MAKRPGGELATRPLHFIWLCDCSGSMSINGKIQALNNGILEALPHMKMVADENPNASVFVRCLKFSHGAEWHVSAPVPLKDFQWADLSADPLQRPNVDIVFLIDTSGSMSGGIEGVKNGCSAFADRVIAEGANVQLGLVGFDIGGHRGGAREKYKVHNLSCYTIGVWPLTAPKTFKNNIKSLSLGLFGGSGCYIADNDTVDIFPHVTKVFEKSGRNSRVLVIISDEMGGTSGVEKIVSKLKKASIVTHVMGVPGANQAHEMIASKTGGKFWDIFSGKYNFENLFTGDVAETVAKEAVKQMANGVVSAGTDMGTALHMIAEQLKIPPMTERALPPVLVLLSDGQPTDDFQKGLKELMKQPWGKKAVRLAIAIGHDADLAVLQDFIGHSEIKPLLATKPEDLVRYIKWASTAVLKAASAPASQPHAAVGGDINVPMPTVPDVVSGGDVW